MIEKLFDTSNTFTAFTYQQWYPIALLSVLMTTFILIAKYKLSEKNQVKFGVALALIPLFFVLARMGFTYYEGTFSIKEELPLHLCRIMALITPFVIAYKNRKWFGILYFLIIIGTLQAVVTPDLQYYAPHYSYFMYWALHMTLIFIPLYCIFVFNFRINFGDFKNAIIYTNVYLLFTLIINYFLESNYFYSRHKPPVSTPLDYFGPWPWYLFVVEFIAIVLFFLAYLPFHKKGKRL